MHETSVAPEHRAHRIPRRAITSSLLIGGILGLAAGLPLGWFAHRLYYQQHAAQVLLCRQQHYGQPEIQLQNLCGSLF